MGRPLPSTLTAKQQAVLDYIRDMIEVMGYPPTRSEMASNFGWKSENSAECHIAMLRRKGYLDTDAGSARGIRLLDKSIKSGPTCPHCGGTGVRL
jgi:repressor LexA